MWTRLGGPLSGRVCTTQEPLIDIEAGGVTLAGFALESESGEARHRLESGWDRKVCEAGSPLSARFKKGRSLHPHECLEQFSALERP
jgi:hypothetical protein